MPNDPDLTTRLNALREVLGNQIAAAERLLLTRMDGQDAARQQYLRGLAEERAGLDRRIQAAKELAGSLNAAMQLQIDQRISSSQDASQRQFADLRKMLDERYETQTKALDAAFKAAEQAVTVALANAEKAVAKAEAASDKRFEAVNEFRKTLSDQTGTFPTRNEVAAHLDSLGNDTARNAQRITDLELRLTSRLDRGEGSDVGRGEQRTEASALFSQRLVLLGVIISVVVIVVNVAITLIVHR